MKCNESSEDICLSKICSAFQTAYAHVTVVWSASGTHKAQEIKAVNKGPSDKGSPDSYESRAGRELAAGSFRTRADGHEKTNHSDEHEGHHLHLALPIHTDFHLFSSSSVAIIYPLIYFCLFCLSASIFSLSFIFLTLDSSVIKQPPKRCYAGSWNCQNQLIQMIVVFLIITSQLHIVWLYFGNEYILRYDSQQVHLMLKQHIA